MYKIITSLLICATVSCASQSQSQEDDKSNSSKTMMKQMPRDAWSNAPVGEDIWSNAVKIEEENIVGINDSKRQKAIGMLSDRDLLQLSPDQVLELSGKSLGSEKNITPILVRAIKSNDLGNFRAAAGNKYLVIGYEHVGPDRPKRWPLIILCKKGTSFSKVYVDESGGM